ncbi:MAG: DmsC/YnfH family molybdoenzyme membrane anchor subunit [Geminicoccaceae bacterium]
MHPAPSIIVFTVLSGAGYGLLLLLGLGAFLGLLPDSRALAGWGSALGLVLVSVGLAASTFHLGHPERAWRALSQWRSSWLSREGVAAVATYAPAVLFAIVWLAGGGPEPWLGLLTALASLATVLCTAMIYASLKPVARWHSPWTPVAFLGLSLACGSALLWLVVALALGPSSREAAGLAAAGAVVGWALQLLYWTGTDAATAPADAGSATGLGRLGRVRLAIPPHVGENYLLREMAFRVGRKHAARLRLLAPLLGGAVPLLLGLLALVTGHAGIALALPAALAALVGTLAGRWLFFAEARHTVTLYYGATTA